MFASSKFDLSSSSFDPHSFLASPEEDFPSPLSLSLSSYSDLESPWTPVSPISPSSSSLTRSDSISSYQSTSTTSTQETYDVAAPLIINDPAADHSYQQEQFLYHEEPLPHVQLSSLADNYSTMNTNTDSDMTVKMEPVEMNSVSVSTILPPLPPVPVSASDPAPITRNKRQQRKCKQTRKRHTHTRASSSSSSSSSIIPLTLPIPDQPIPPTIIPDDFDVQLIKEMKWNSAQTWQRYSMIRNGTAFDWCVPRSCLGLVLGASQNNRQRAIQYQRLPTLLAPEFKRRTKVGIIHPTTQKTSMISSTWVIKILQFRMTDSRTKSHIQHAASNLLHELVQRGCA